MKKIKEILKKAVLDFKTRQKVGETGDSSPIGTGRPKTPQEDPFRWSDTKHKQTLGELQIRHKTGKPIQIHTSSDLVGHDDYAAHIPKGSEINLYSNGHYPNNTQGFPSQSRLEITGKKLQSLGHKVNYHGFTKKPSNPKYTGTGTSLKVAKSKLEKDLIPPSPKMQEAIDKQRTKQGGSDSVYDGPKVVKSLKKSQGPASPHKKMMGCLEKCKSMMTNQKDPLIKQDMGAMAPPAPDSGAATMPQPISGTN